MKNIMWFSEIRKENIPEVGGKGANLGEMASAKFPVPPGFVITSGAYFDFIKSNHIDAFIKDMTEELDVSKNDQLTRASEMIKARILSGVISEQLRSEIITSYRQLCAQRGKMLYVAVRSSATAEDLPEASFAGQQATFLNISGEAEVVQATKECWASLYEPRAIFYRVENHFDHMKVGLAAVIQEMVQSEVAGVMFTVDPVSQDLGLVSIEAAYGLGEVVVSGSVTPDRYLIRKGTWRIETREINRQSWMLLKVRENNEKKDVKEEMMEAQKLSDERVLELAKIGGQIEAHYGKPQDIEWAFADNTLFIVQSRPVTTLKGASLAAVQSGKFLQMISSQYKESESMATKISAAPASRPSSAMAGVPSMAGAPPASRPSPALAGVPSIDGPAPPGGMESIRPLSYAPAAAIDTRPAPSPGSGFSAPDVSSPAALASSLESPFRASFPAPSPSAASPSFSSSSAPSSSGGKPMASSDSSNIILSGHGASPGVGKGLVRILNSAKDMGDMQQGEVLVTDMTTPDFVPAMKKAAAIITNTGGMTAHAAIVSRELGVPCIVGATGATTKLKTGQFVTVDALRGKVYDGDVPIDSPASSAAAETQMAGVGGHAYVPTGTKIYVNLAEVDLAGKVSQLPCDGVGLLRAEFIIAGIGEHPRKIINEGRQQEFIDKLADNLRTFASAFYPRPVVYRATDFKTNEYRNLKGGEQYEPVESNPMMGYRGCARYIAEPDVFAMELAAIKKVREEFGMKNLWLMIPFVRRIGEIRAIKDMLRQNGIHRTRDFKLWIMCEVPSTVVLIDEFCQEGIDGVSIGSNDLTQLTLGIDRDNSTLAEGFDERNAAVLKSIEKVVKSCAKYGVTCSLCGQAPSVYPDFAEKLVDFGITSMSVNPDAVERTRRIVASAEMKVLLKRLSNLEKATGDIQSKIGQDD